MLKSFRSNLLLLELNVIVTLLWLKRLSTVTINIYFFIKTLIFCKNIYFSSGEVIFHVISMEIVIFVQKLLETSTQGEDANFV